MRAPRVNIGVSLSSVNFLNVNFRSSTTLDSYGPTLFSLDFASWQAMAFFSSAIGVFEFLLFSP